MFSSSILPFFTRALVYETKVFFLSSYLANIWKSFNSLKTGTMQRFMHLMQPLFTLLLLRFSFFISVILASFSFRDHKTIANRNLSKELLKFYEQEFSQRSPPLNKQKKNCAFIFRLIIYSQSLYNMLCISWKISFQEFFSLFFRVRKLIEKKSFFSDTKNKTKKKEKQHE